MSDILDVFDDEAFDVVTLSDEVSRMPHQPMRIGQMGLFETKGIRTTDLGIQERNGTLALIPYTERDAPDNVMNGGRARVVKVETGHFPLKRVIRPSEIQNARSLDISSGNVQLVAAQEVVREKAGEMIPLHDATLEYQRLGAIKGYLMDANGTDIMHDLYDLMKVEPKTVYFDLSNNATKVRIKCLQAIELIETALGGTVYLGVRALCGKEFFNDLISHPDVEKAYERWAENGQQGAMLRNDPRFTGFEFGGIFWEVYRGQVGGVDFIADDECQIFPIGVPGMFITRFSPANMMEFVNTLGLPRYASIERLKHGRGVELLTESNPISVNTRPNASIKGSSAAS
jgi:hypothetical protein